MPSPYVPVGIRKSGFTTSNVIAQGNRVTAGKVNMRADFRYNTRFPKQWSRQPATRKLWAQMVDIAKNQARRTVRVGRTGALQKSIKGEVILTNSGGYIQGRVVAGGIGLERWAFIEYGTGQRGIASDQPAPGRPVGYRSRPGWVGNRAYPYLRPALIGLRTRVQSLSVAS